MLTDSAKSFREFQGAKYLTRRMKNRSAESLLELFAQQEGKEKKKNRILDANFSSSPRKLDRTRYVLLGKQGILGDLADELL
jgi:hypothetical protein